MRTICTIKIPERTGMSRMDRDKTLAHFRELHKRRTGREPPEVHIGDGYLIVSMKQPSPR